MENLNKYGDYLDEVHDNDLSGPRQDFPKMRICATCGQNLLESENFPKGRPGKYRSVCNRCQSKRNSASYKKHADSRRARNRLRYHERYSPNARKNRARENRMPDPVDN